MLLCEILINKLILNVKLLDGYILYFSNILLILDFFQHESI